jgi:hypothetical protein
MVTDNRDFRNEARGGYRGRQETWTTKGSTKIEMEMAIKMPRCRLVPDNKARSRRMAARCLVTPGTVHKDPASCTT